ncbi:hypothetical protein HDU78_010638, partial [Chytriomyces hyalinus]
MQVLLFVLSLLGVSHASFWLKDIKHQGVLPFGGDSAYTVFRDVRAYGAIGDGITDDTAAINKAITEGKRCGLGCDSTTATPAIIYFPPGTYLVSAPLIQYYYTFMIGDANQLPTIKAAANFVMTYPWFTYVIDADPYGPGGVNWFVNQNNFFRQIRNLKIDLTGLPASALIGGIHWQVSQATSLQNIEITMAPASPENQQKGIFIENGSGGFFTDIVLNGGNIGMDVGNQQFTTRNIVFNGCNTAVTMSWDWGWVFKSLQINTCDVGIDMSAVNPSSGKQDVGSVILLDSKISNTGVGIKTSFGIASNGSSGSLIVDNVNFDNTASAVTDSGEVVLSPPFRMRDHLDNIEKPSGLLDASGKFFERSKPQYKDLPASAFLSVKSAGAKGDGATDDTDAIQKVLNLASSSQVVFFDHGAYLVSRTILVPKGVRIVGEAWPIILAKGTAFQNPAAPVPVFQVGNAGDVGSVEISDLMFETSGPQPGAILIQFNMKPSSPGATGMWDVHGRVGGTVGSHLQQGECLHGSLNYDSCSGPFLMMHITKSAGVYIENSWMWTADHDLDSGGSTQVSIFTGRGVLIESESPVWLYGTAAEHNQLYNYQFSGASNIFAAMLQSETPYYQGTPDALKPFKTNAEYNDPDFSNCLPGSKSCIRSWGLRVVQSSNIMIYGAGLYSFFENYGQACIGTLSCQDNMVSIEASKGVSMFNLNTVGTSNMIAINSVPSLPAENLHATYCSTLAMFVIAGKSSGDLPPTPTPSKRIRPFWVVGHNPNTMEEVQKFIDQGANALEPDFAYRSYGGGAIAICHSANPEKECGTQDQTAQDYLNKLREKLTAQPDKISTIMLDIKTSLVRAPTSFGAPMKLMNLIHNLTQSIPLNIMYSVSSLDEAKVFFTPEFVKNLGPKEGIYIDYENQPQVVLDYYKSINAPRYGYGNGISFANPGQDLWAPNIRPSIREAAWYQAATGQGQSVGTWTSNARTDQLDFIRGGVSSIIVDTSKGSSDPYVRGIQSLISLIKLNSEVKSLVRFGTIKDNLWTSNLGRYALSINVAQAVKTVGRDRDLVTFTLVGAKGRASCIVDYSYANRLDIDNPTYATIISEDLGKLSKIIVESPVSTKMIVRVVSASYKQDMQFSDFADISNGKTEVNLVSSSCPGLYPCKGAPAGATCKQNRDCQNRACGRFGKGGDYQCCPRATLEVWGTSDYCMGVVTGTSCHTDAKCASGYCKDNVCTERKQNGE